MRVSDLIGSRKEVSFNSKEVLGARTIPARETGAVGRCRGCLGQDWLASSRRAIFRIGLPQA